MFSGRPITRRAVAAMLAAAPAAILGILGLRGGPAAAEALEPKRCRQDECGWVYDPAVGDPDGGIPPGVAFEDLPDDWRCPNCGLPKARW